jgi:hypothetical protein
MRRGGIQKKNVLEGAVRDHGGLKESGRECKGAEDCNVATHITKIISICIYL